MKNLKYLALSKRTLIATILVLMFVSLGIAPLLSQAAVNLSEPLGKAKTGLYGTAVVDDLPTQIGKYIKFFLGLLGIILLIVIIYGGFTYMTAGGDKEKVKEGTKWIINGVIGIAIVLSAYAITEFVVTKLAGGTGAVGGG